MWLFVHRPFEVWPILGTIHLERVYMIFVIAAWLFGANEKRQLGNVFTAGVFFYTFAIGTSALFSSYSTILTNIDWIEWLKYMVFFVILMTSVKTEKDFKIIIAGFTVAGFLYMAHSYREYLLGRVFINAGVPRLHGVNVTFGEMNDYGTTLVCFLPMLLPLLLLCKKNWHYLYALGYLLLTLRSVQLTGSRTAMIMALGLFTLPLLFSRYRFRLFPILLLLMPAGWFAMPETLQNRFRTMVDASVSEEANRNYQARIDYFWIGMENWGNSPLFGVGPGHHGTPRGGQQAHNLPGQVAGEAGTLGIVAFLTMFACYGINFFNIKRNYKILQDNNCGKEGLFCWRVNVAVMYAVAMILLQGIGLHNAYRFYWVWFGAFQALAAMLMQEKVDSLMRGVGIRR